MLRSQYCKGVRVRQNKLFVHITQWCHDADHLMWNPGFPLQNAWHLKTPSSQIKLFLEFYNQGFQYKLMIYIQSISHLEHRQGFPHHPSVWIKSCLKFSFYMGCWKHRASTCLEAVGETQLMESRELNGSLPSLVVEKHEICSRHPRVKNHQNL